MIGSKEKHEFNIEKILTSFKKSSESDNYSLYRYPFSICLFQFLVKKFNGIEPLRNEQYELLEKQFCQL